jgi:hypothetical protein
VGLRAGERTLEQKEVKASDVHAARVNWEHISPINPCIGMTILNIAKHICRDRGGQQKSPAEKALNIRRMIFRFKSDASNPFVRGIIIDDCCSHECLPGCDLLSRHGLKVGRLVETTVAEEEPPL